MNTGYMNGEIGDLESEDKEKSFKSLRIRVHSYFRKEENLRKKNSLLLVPVGASRGVDERD